MTELLSLPVERLSDQELSLARGILAEVDRRLGSRQGILAAIAADLQAIAAEQSRRRGSQSSAHVFGASGTEASDR